ncbi:MAG: glutathione S-transferase family protein [Gammaproteobacteria bacterium]
MATVILHQFPYSHFNDKVRWALAFKGIAHRRRDYLPGPHIPAIRRLSGQSQTPVLEWDGEIVAGSAAIIDFLEIQVPMPALHPADPGERAAAEDLVARFDRELGPATRAVLFAVLIDEPDYFCALFAGDRPPWQRWLYRASFPLARPLVARGNAVDRPELVARAEAVTTTILADIATRVAVADYLVGNAFSIADLTAAALIAPLFEPPVTDMARPQPQPAAMLTLKDRWARHPAVAWAERIYRDHGARS